MRFGHGLDGVSRSVYSRSSQGGGGRSIRLRAWWTCVGEAVPQTITEGVAVLVLICKHVLYGRSCGYWKSQAEIRA